MKQRGQGEHIKYKGPVPGNQSLKKASVASARNEAYLAGNSRIFKGLNGHFKDFDLYPKNSEKPLNFLSCWG